MAEAIRRAIPGRRDREAAIVTELLALLHSLEDAADALKMDTASGPAD